MSPPASGRGSVAEVGQRGAATAGGPAWTPGPGPSAQRHCAPSAPRLAGRIRPARQDVVSWQHCLKLKLPCPADLVPICIASALENHRRTNSRAQIWKETTVLLDLMPLCFLTGTSTRRSRVASVSICCSRTTASTVLLSE